MSLLPQHEMPSDLVLTWGLYHVFNGIIRRGRVKTFYQRSVDHDNSNVISMQMVLLCYTLRGANAMCRNTKHAVEIILLCTQYVESILVEVLFLKLMLVTCFLSYSSASIVPNFQPPRHQPYTTVGEPNIESSADRRSLQGSLVADDAASWVQGRESIVRLFSTLPERKLLDKTSLTSTTASRRQTFHNRVIDVWQQVIFFFLRGISLQHTVDQLSWILISLPRSENVYPFTVPP